jgi:F0F1-type ATP synthase assembly protein I
MQNKELIAAIITLASTLIPIIIGFIAGFINRVKAVKKAKEALAESKTEEERQRAEAEKQAAMNDLKTLAQGFVVEAENLYKSVDTLVKQTGGTCGAQKKDSVMTKILQACLTKGVAFDEEYWSKTIDELVEVTRKVNAK